MAMAMPATRPRGTQATMFSTKKRSRYHDAMLVVMMVLFVTAGMADAQERSGGTSIVVYSKENGIATGWRDHSWGDETEVEAWSGAPIEASVGSWGALALASVVGEGEEERSNAVQASDGAEVVIVFQGPEGSSEGGANDWLYLTDGRAVPKLTSRQHVKSLRRPLDLGRVRVYLEDSESGRSSRDFLLSGLLSPPAVKADDSEFLEASFLVAPALESSGMDKFDKIVLKDAKGSGFALRVARVEIRPSDAAAETPREVAEVYSKTEGGSPAISIRSWLPGDANVDDADVEGGPEAVALRSLENFKSRPRCEEYGAPVERSRISDASLKEPSGFAASRRYEGILWTHQDRDTDPYLYAVIASTGEVVSKIYVDTKKYGETDWEDIAVALCPDGSGDHCVWIADSGNVARDRETFYVHVMKEPTLEVSVRACVCKREECGFSSSDALRSSNHIFSAEVGQDRGAPSLDLPLPVPTRLPRLGGRPATLGGRGVDDGVPGRIKALAHGEDGQLQRQGARDGVADAGWVRAQGSRLQGRRQYPEGRDEEG